MAEQRSRNGSRRVRSFSATAVAELREVLGDAAATLTPLLAELARTHDSFEKRKRGAGWATATEDRPGTAEGRRLAASMRTTIRLIDEYLPFAASRGTLADLAGGDTETMRLAALRRDLPTRLKVIEAHLRSPQRRRGRPQDIGRNSLGHDIGIVLRLSGTRVTTSRNGKFAKVLAIVQTEVYGAAPDDQFRFIQKVAQAVNKITLDELRDIVREAAKYHADSAFWLRLAQ